MSHTLSAFLRLFPYFLIFIGSILLLIKTQDKMALIMVIGLVVMFGPSIFFLLKSLSIINEICDNTPYILIGIMATINLIGTITASLGFFLFTRKLFKEKTENDLC